MGGPGIARTAVALRWFCVAMLPSGLAPVLSAQSIAFSGYPVPGSPNYIAAGPDGAIWFTDSAYGEIGRITTAGAVTEYATPTPNSSPQGITSGPDGAIWFVEEGANNVGRITSSGAIMEYEIPTPISGPMGITAGPDGALWFTEYEGGVGGKIGRITTAGAITEYATPTLNSGPYGIASGPDGAIWFVECGAEKIGRITVEGVITEFALPGVLYNPAQIAVGPDGTLWFTKFGPSLGRITTGGAITSYSLFNFPSLGAACGITAGTDGALWFTVCSGGEISPEIGRITMAGAVELYTLTTTTSGSGITLGPDGALWFADGSSIERAALVFPTPMVVDVRNGADEYLQTFQSNAWVTIYGSNLAPTGSGRGWGEQDIVNGKLPLSLDGVSVTINGKPAYVEYISPTQVNVLAPDDAATGPVDVIIANGGYDSTAFSADVQTYSPAFFTLSPPNQRYIAAIIPSGPGGAFDYLAPSGAVAGDSSRPAMGGDTVVLYATGFGPTNPTPPDGEVFSGAFGTATPVAVTIGGLNATVAWAGLVSPGLVQLNVSVPVGLPNGDAAVVASVGGVQSQSDVFIPVEQ
jgi:virginiamycin B lyase